MYSISTGKLFDQRILLMESSDLRVVLELSYKFHLAENRLGSLKSEQHMELLYNVARTDSFCKLSPHLGNQNNF